MPELLEGIIMESLIDTLEHFNKDHIYNDVLDYLYYNIESDTYNIIENSFRDLCFDNDVNDPEDLFNDDCCILSEYSDLDCLKNITGVLQYSDYEKITFLDLETIQEIISNNPESYLKRISAYICYHLENDLKVFDSSTLYNRIDSFCYDKDNIKDIITNIKNGFIDSDKMLHKYIISFFCERMDCIL